MVLLKHVLGVCHKFLEVIVYKVHNQEDRLEVVIITCKNYLMQLCCINIICHFRKLGHDLYFSRYILCEDLVLENILDVLKSKLLAGRALFYTIDMALCSSAKVFFDPVLWANYLPIILLNAHN